MSVARKITNHDEIREWTEARGGRPAIVRGTESRDSALLRIDFGEPDEKLEKVSWDEFFAIFDRNKLALLEQDETAGGRPSRFSKFVNR
jgi:hypothetical protein